MPLGTNWMEKVLTLPERTPLWYSNPLKSTVNQTSDTLFDNWIFRDAGLLILSWMSHFISLVVAGLYFWTLTISVLSSTEYSLIPPSCPYVCLIQC